jgi:hypothetical protein
MAGWIRTDVDGRGTGAYKARMRTALASLLLLSVASAVAADKATAPATGQLQARQPAFDAGKVERGTILRHSFVLRNVGKAALSIDAKPG